MPTTEQYLNSLISDKNQLVANLKTKGIEADENETFTSLVPKVLDIQGESSGESAEYYDIEATANGSIRAGQFLALTPILTTNSLLESYGLSGKTVIAYTQDYEYVLCGSSSTASSANIYKKNHDTGKYDSLISVTLPSQSTSYTYVPYMLHWNNKVILHRLKSASSSSSYTRYTADVNLWYNETENGLTTSSQQITLDTYNPIYFIFDGELYGFGTNASSYRSATYDGKLKDSSNNIVIKNIGSGIKSNTYLPGVTLLIHTDGTFNISAPGQDTTLYLRNSEVPIRKNVSIISTTSSPSRLTYIDGVLAGEKLVKNIATNFYKVDEFFTAQPYDSGGSAIGLYYKDLNHCIARISTSFTKGTIYNGITNFNNTYSVSLTAVASAAPIYSVQAVNDANAGEKVICRSYKYC